MILCKKTWEILIKSPIRNRSGRPWAGTKTAPDPGRHSQNPGQPDQIDPGYGLGRPWSRQSSGVLSIVKIRSQPKLNKAVQQGSTRTAFTKHEQMFSSNMETNTTTVQPNTNTNTQKANSEHQGWRMAADVWLTTWQRYDFCTNLAEGIQILEK